MFTFLTRRASVLSQLKSFTSVSVDTGNLSQIKEFAPDDATTNPSLILSAVQSPEVLQFVHSILLKHNSDTRLSKKALNSLVDDVTVQIAKRITELVPGYVSIEVDPRLSFHSNSTYKKALEIIERCKANGVDKSRILIKIASTWEGIQAASRLNGVGINTNMTLIFNLAQAVACADAKATVISPFVGRILDWHKRQTGKNFTGAEDPGVKSVTEIYYYLKKYYSKSPLVMGASFRNVDEIIELAGCDKLTISPVLLGELNKLDSSLIRKLDPSHEFKVDKLKRVNETRFRWLLNQDAMATEKLSEGIRKFAEDTESLHKFIRKELKAVNKTKS